MHCTRCVYVWRGLLHSARAENLHLRASTARARAHHWALCTRVLMRALRLLYFCGQDALGHRAQIQYALYKS